MNQDELSACVRAAQGDSLRSFEILVQQFQDMAVGYGRILLNDFHLAEDAAQDAFVQAYTHLAQLQNTEAFPGWFRQIVFSCCMRYRRRRKVDTVQFETAAYVVDPHPLPDMVLASKERAALLNKAMMVLNEKEKTALSLHYIRRHSTREIAAFLDVSPTTVKNRIHSARKKLHGRLLSSPASTLSICLPQADPSLVAILITGWDLDADDRRLSLFDFRLQKPFDDIAEIETVVARAIARHGEQAEEHRA